MDQGYTVYVNERTSVSRVKMLKQGRRQCKVATEEGGEFDMCQEKGGGV